MILLDYVVAGVLVLCRYWFWRRFVRSMDKDNVAEFKRLAAVVTKIYDPTTFECRAARRALELMADAVAVAAEPEPAK